MSPRSGLLGSRIRIPVVVLVVVAVVIGGAFALGVLGTPPVTDVQNRLGGVNESTTVIESNLTDSSPNPFGTSFGSLLGSYVPHIR